MQATTVSERPDRLAAGWLALIPGLITLVVTLYRIGVPRSPATRARRWSHIAMITSDLGRGWHP